MKTVIYLFLFIYIKCCENVPIETTPMTVEFDLSSLGNTSHFDLDIVKKICKDRPLCKNNDTKVCTVRKINDTFEFKDFQNSCHLFMANMCDFPGAEFYILNASSCSTEITRRHFEPSGVEIEYFAHTTTTVDDNIKEDNTNDDHDSNNNATTKPGLRTVSIKQYPVEKCMHGHVCAPVVCPNVYHPVCMILNHRYKALPKMFTFVNHCEMDKFYCSHYPEFEIPEDLDEPYVATSYLNWSYCSAQRYLKYLFTVKSISSIGHYGWLEGDEIHTRILDEWQRKPGFG